ncbi:MAG: thioredoxin family protein [Nitrospirota bacterium]|jgi:thioredoxin-like negative regulator of GroEL
MAIVVEVFSSPGCAKCVKAKDEVLRFIRENGRGAVELREVNVLDEMDRALDLGVMATPAIAIDGDLVFRTLPREKALRAELSARLERKREP